MIPIIGTILLLIAGRGYIPQGTPHGTLTPDQVIIDDPLTEAPTTTSPPSAACDVWCAEIAAAYAAYQAGDPHGAVRHAAAAYGLPEWADWGIATIHCETGGTWDPQANSGWYVGWTQQDPQWWDDRSAAAGFPDAAPTNPIASAATMFSMIRAQGHEGWTNWPICGRNPALP